MPDLLTKPGRAGLFFSLLCVALAPAAPAQTGVVRGGTLPPLFPADNWWNVDVSQAPLDPSGSSFLDFIGRTKGLHPDFGGDSTPFPEIYGMVFMSVPGTQPLEPVAFDYADESDAGAPGRPAGYPIPPQAKTEPKWLEGGYAGSAVAGGDKHLLIVDRDNKLLFETWNTRCEPPGSGTCSWRAGSGAVFRLDSNARRPDGWTSADAAGLAILPGLVRYEEAYGSQPIPHAFRFTVRATNGYVYPASHRAGSTAGAPPMGLRMRLKASKDVSSYPEPVRKIFQAMKTYGLILADNGSDMYVSGAYDTRWDNDLLNPAFAGLKVSDFEVVQRGWQPSGGGGGGPGTCVPDAATLCLMSRFKVTARYRTYDGQQGDGQAVALTSDTGTFWFFTAANVEAMIKIVGFCGTGVNRWSVYANGLTDLDVTFTVTDTTSGTVKTYHNNLGQPFVLIRDAAFTCP